MKMKEEYKNCEYDIRIYKTKDMPASKQIIKGDNKIVIMTAIYSLLLSCLNAKLMTTEELKDLVNYVIKSEKEGMKNKVVYNSLEAEDE